MGPGDGPVGRRVRRTWTPRQQSKARPALQKCGRACSSSERRNHAGEGTQHRCENMSPFLGCGTCAEEDHDGVEGPRGDADPEQALQVGLEGPSAGQRVCSLQTRISHR